MPINLAEWQDEFSTLPRWLCPTCFNSYLSPRNEKLHGESRGVLAQKFRPAKSGPSKRLICLLECNYCQELVTICGDGHPDEGFRVASMYPPILPIKLPPDTPRTVRDNIVHAAQLLWPDQNAAAVRLRQAIERILDDQGISANDEQGRKLELGKRIDDIDHPHFSNEIKYLLRIIKDYGDNGAHKADLARGNVLTSFASMEVLLDKLYDTNFNRVVKAARSARGETLRRRNEG